MTHSPFPLICRQRKYGPVVLADFREAVNKCLMTATIIGFKRQNVHTNILRQIDRQIKPAGGGYIRRRRKRIVKPAPTASSVKAGGAGMILTISDILIISSALSKLPVSQYHIS